jgi:xanthine dehydrogenase large subunit
MRTLIPATHLQRLRPARHKAAADPHGGEPLHESASKHVTGSARYVDDLPEPAQLLHLAAGVSTIAHGRLRRLDLDAVRASPGVVAVLTAADVPGELDIGPVYGGDPLLSADLIEFIGQPLFFVAACDYISANRAVQQAVVEYEELAPVLSIEAALAQQLLVRPTHTMRRGDAEAGLAAAVTVLEGELYIGGQEHFYLEGQIALALPTEDGGMHIHTSSQHPAEVQKLVAEVLALPMHKVHAEVRRLGGGFGGKETQAAPLACAAALAAWHTGCAVKYRMPRAADMAHTGKRHDFLARYRLGVDADGRFTGVKIHLAGKCGCSPDLSDGIVDRAMFHADNAYFLNQAEVVGARCKTHTVSATAFRGFGGPQGMAVAEAMIDHVARHLGLDPLQVRERNFYAPGRDCTHYGQTVEQHQLQGIVDTLQASADYAGRRAAVTAFNASHRWLKQGLALTPVKFGISFTAQHLNQAGALVHIYTDGSIEVAHAGTEMGQGLYTKVAQVVATEFGVPPARVNCAATRTDKVPNGSPTAASSGTDLNGKAAQNACITLRNGLVEFACAHFGVSAAQIRFGDGQVTIGAQQLSFADFIQLAYLHRVPLSASGFYKTPKIHYDRASASGRPFLYYANGAAVAEVLVDILTGEYRVTRVDICHDVGKSLNSVIDTGQIEGGFVQGMGWVTTEELRWDASGRVLTDSPATYKIPTAADVPAIFNVQLYQEDNREDTLYASKAVGEPPLMLALSVWCALKDAVASLADYRISPRLDIPATPEKVLGAIMALQAERAAATTGGDEHAQSALE